MRAQTHPVRMTMTLVYDAGQERDVTVTAPPGTVLGDVATQLRAAVDKPAAALYAGSTRLRDDTPFGSPGLRHGCILGVGTIAPRRDDSSSVLELRVVSGLLAGQTFGLGRGEHVIGRGSTCELHLDDPLCSRRHAVLGVAADGVTVADAGSTNGTRLDGTPVGTEPAPIAVGQLLRLGDSVLSLAVPADIPAVTRATRDGTVAVNRPPRLIDAPTETTIDWPSPPQPSPPPRLALIALVLPIVAGVLLAVLLRMPQFLLFTLLSPLFMLGTFLSARTGRRRNSRQDKADYELALRRAGHDRDRAVALDSVARRRACPDLASVRTTAQRTGQRLWERRPDDRDFALLRIGTGTQAGGVSVRTDGRSEPVMAADLPVIVSLAAVGVLGLAGPDGPLLAMGRSLLCQLGTLHSPRDLQIVLLTTRPRSALWNWARWLPQLRRVDTVSELTALLDRRQAEPRAGTPDTVLVLHEAGRLRAEPGVTRLLTDGPAAGILALCLDRHERQLPAECRAVAAVCGDVGTRLRLSVDHFAHDDVLADGLPLPVARDIARALAALRDPGDGASRSLPGKVRLLDLLGMQQPSGALLAAAWAASDLAPRAVLGRATTGPYAVDLARDGPHALVAGTTGAGKSELLQTLIAALAATVPPTAVQFVLVDYKGGAAFRDCADLPHTVGLVTDLDAHLTRRALRSLAAELTRRERVLAADGAGDLAGYRGSEPVPRLVIVVDEFAALAKELPDFVSGLVAIAARGRSLGIHLVLATQRPGGAVTPEIRANTTLRIALRVTDDGESRDIVDQSGAAGISKRTPGRALIRAGSEPATMVQTARVAGHAPPPPPPPRVVVAGTPPPARAIDAEGPTDLQRIVGAAREAARLTGWQTLPSPWLPPLPDLLRREDLADAPAGVAVLGLIDHPDEQCRSVLGLDVAADAALLIAGGQRSGRSTAVRTLIASLALGWNADELHLHVIDCAGGGLLSAARLAHCGSAIGRDDTFRGRRLLARLLEETEHRQLLLANAGASSLAEYHATRPTQDRPPYVVLVLDGWEGFVQTYEPVDAGQPVETLLRVIREGAAAGFRVVITSDRAGLGVRLSGVIARRIVLPLADRGDYALAGIPARAVPAQLPPGRGLLPGSALECQIAVLGADPSGAAQVAALDAIAEATPEPTLHPPLRIAELPSSVGLDRLPGPHRPMWTVLGLGGDDALPIQLDLGSLGPAFLLAGPARSGKSTALLVLATGLLHAGTPVVVVAGRRSTLRSLSGVPAVISPGDGEALRAATAQSPAVVLADDIESLVDSPVDAVLTSLVRDDRGVTVVGAGRSDDLAGAFRGVGVELRRRRTGLLLTPGPLDGELLGVRLPRGLTERLPGRGYLVEHGNLTRVQVALPPKFIPGAGTPP
ncbi:MAG: FtsK/SpoIIIE domain-containing protein [Geodermatophilaceae bacterium]